MGLQDAVTTQHGPSTPNTHNRGSTPIDGIFVPSNFIPAIYSGYLVFGEGIPSNHRAVWVDILIETLGWFKTVEWIPSQAWWLKCEDPWLVKRYLQALEEELTKPTTFTRLKILVQQVSGHWLTCAQKIQLETINSETTMAKLAAEKWCRKLPVGKVQWCPKITQAIARILYIKKHQGGGHISTKYLICLAKKVAPATIKNTLTRRSPK